MTQILGWFGFAFFFAGAWLLGERESWKRLWGISLMAGCNVLFAIQAFLTANWSLLALSVVAAALQARAALAWRKFDQWNERS